MSNINCLESTRKSILCNLIQNMPPPRCDESQFFHTVHARKAMSYNYYGYSLLVLQNFTTAQKSGNILFKYWKLFSSDSHQSMKTSDNILQMQNAPRHIQAAIFGSLGKQDRLFIEVFWNLFTSRLKTQSCVDKKSSFSHWDSSSKQW